ncbi:MAG: LPS export ABC transporter periplasmic protein LptC [Bacteroidetes bacterium]|nr:LPS export ABC transporter periplasmic protein LptC [Bacteroidota bacterium]
MLLPQSGTAQQDESKKIHITADSLINANKGGEAITKLVGNFSFYQGSLTGTAKRAEQHPNKNYVDLFDDVVIRQDTLALYAPHVKYEGNTRTATADGYIQFSDRDDHITSVWGAYDLDQGIAQFHDGVRAVQGNSTLSCDHLTYIRSTQTMIAHGNVVVYSDSGMLHCDSLIDARSIGERTAFGDVQIKNDSLIVFCQYLYDSKPQNTLLTSGEVQAYSIANRTMQFGDTIIRDTKTGRSFVPSRPLLEIIDTSQRFDSVSASMTTVFDTLFVRSKTMEAVSGDSGRFVATDSVLLMRNNFSGKCGKMVYYREQGILTLFGNKRQYVWYDSTEINGDSIVMYEHNNKPERIVAYGHAFATTPYSDSVGTKDRTSQLSAQSMVLTIVRDTVRSLLAVDNALSIYFMSSEGKPNGLNRASGDSIRIDFEHNSPERIVVLSHTEQEFWPERYVGYRGAAFRLGNFERQYDLLHPRRAIFAPDWEPHLVELSEHMQQTEH